MIHKAPGVGLQRVWRLIAMALLPGALLGVLSGTTVQHAIDAPQPSALVLAAAIVTGALVTGLCWWIGERALLAADASDPPMSVRRIAMIGAVSFAGALGVSAASGLAFSWAGLTLVAPFLSALSSAVVAAFLWRWSKGTLGQPDPHALPWDGETWPKLLLTICVFAPSAVPVAGAVEAAVAACALTVLQQERPLGFWAWVYPLAVAKLALVIVARGAGWFA